MSGASRAGPILVVGGAGLVGRAVVRAMQEARCSVDAIVHRPPGNVCDIRDRDAVMEAIQRLRPSTVINAAYLLADRTAHDHKRAVEVNVAGFLNVAEASLAAGATSYLYASSIAVYGPTWDGTPRPAPATIYGTMKLLNEQTVAALDGFERHCGVRIANVYDDMAGRGQTGWLSNAVQAALDGRPAMVALGRRARMSIVWARDLGTRIARVACLGRDHPLPATIDSGGESVSGADLERALLAAGASSVQLEDVQYEYPSDARSEWLDGVAGAPVLGLTDALAEMKHCRADARSKRS